jgi:hypothetical protein
MQIFLIDAILVAYPADSNGGKQLGAGIDAPLTEVLSLTSEPSLEGAVAYPCCSG